jgi:hypothetical protein
MHASIRRSKADAAATTETADLYLYRYAEKKAQQIGQVTRLLKEISVDCILNKDQKSLGDQNKSPVTQRLSSDPKTIIEIVPQDHPYTAICDYMDTCEYKCAGERALTPHDSTYALSFLKYNRAKWADAIRDLFRDANTIMFSVNQVVKTLGGPREEIEYAIRYLATNALEYVHDSLGRRGTILLVEDRYIVFQPMELANLRASVYERSRPAPYFPESIDAGPLFSAPGAERVKPAIDVKNTIVRLEQNVSRILGLASGEEEAAAAANFEDKQSWSAQAQQAIKAAETGGLHLSLKNDAIERHLVSHFVDELSLAEKVSLFSVAESSPYAKYLRDYWEKLTVKASGPDKGPDKGPDWLVVFEKEGGGKNAFFYWDGTKWHPSTSASFKTSVGSEKLIKTAKWRPTAYHDHPVGFMAQHNEDVVFKVADSKKSKGIQLYNGYNTKAIDTIFRDYIAHKGIDVVGSETLSAKGKVVILELLMRQYGDFDSAEKRALYEEFNA